MGARQLGDERRPHVTGLRITVDQDDRAAGAGDAVVQAHAVHLRVGLPDLDSRGLRGGLGDAGEGDADAKRGGE